MTLGRLNHNGVATPSIENSIALYRDMLGATTIHAPFVAGAEGGCASSIRRYADRTDQVTSRLPLQFSFHLHYKHM